MAFLFCIFAPMIDSIKNIVYAILNKEKVGAVKPARFIDSCIKAQDTIYANYFTPETHKAHNRIAAGIAPNALRLLEEKLSPFYKSEILTSDNAIFDKPDDLYFIEDRGLSYANETEIDILKAASFRRESGSEVFPIGTFSENQIKVKPLTINAISIDYYRKPKKPKWTYFESGGIAYFNPDAVDFQDFELHPSEFTNIISEILLDFGIIKRETELTQFIDNFKKTENANDSRVS